LNLSAGKGIDAGASRSLMHWRGSDAANADAPSRPRRVPIDIHYDRITGGLTFFLLRSRAQIVAVGREKLAVAALADVIRSKEAANRPKDRAVLPILRDTLMVKSKLER
jgi:hypothetical protein